MKTPARRCAALAFLAMGLSGCVGGGTAVMNKPLSSATLTGDGPISQGGYRVAGIHGTQSSGLLVLLGFSGGGKRSAAFGYGVLRGLRDYYIPVNGSQHRLLDEVDMMSSVSGGSFPAAYYGLYRDKIFTDFESDFLNRDINAYIYGTYLLPWHFVNAMFNPNHGTNDRMAEVYDDLMFHGATYADMMRAGKPLVSVNATDVDHGLAFQFTQDQFDLLCSDLNSYPLARAVAASNGFPIVFSPITLKSYRSDCAGRVPRWIREDEGKGDPLSRTHELAEISRLYLDSNATRYVHLMDGGIADNLAMRGMINTIMVISGATEVSQHFNLAAIRRVVLISSDGQSANGAASAREEHLTSLGQMFNAVSGTQIDSYNFETMVLARKELDALREVVRKARCAQGPIAADGHPCEDIQTFFAHLSLAGIKDEAERKRLAQIPTGLTIDSPDVALLVAAGEVQVKESPDLSAFRNSLNRQTAVSPRSAPTSSIGL
jgi:NTE family protein